MREDIAGPEGASSRPMWEVLEGMVQEKAQEGIQQIMEEKVTELLGREKPERRKAADGPEGFRNGSRRAKRRPDPGPRSWGTPGGLRTGPAASSLGVSLSLPRCGQAGRA